MRTETLECGHAPSMEHSYQGKPAWQFVVDKDGRKICRACADARVLDCGHTPSPRGHMTAGYGTGTDGRTVCYACCADADRAGMLATGRATLYLSGDASGGQVSNWPGSLTFAVNGFRSMRHNIAGRQYIAYFTGPDGARWSARQYGDNTQVAHCRRLK